MGDDYERDHQEDIMTDHPVDASRRDFIAAAVIVAAAAADARGAQAQTPSNPRFSNPPGKPKPAGYSPLGEVSGPHPTIYLSCQNASRAHRQPAGDLRA